MSVDRASLRYATNATIAIYDNQARELATGRATNLSRGGVCAEIATAVPSGETVDVRITLVFDPTRTSEPLSLPARTVWCTAIDEFHQAGFAFLAPSAERVRDLDMFIRFLADRHDGDSAPIGDDDDRLRFGG